MSELLRELAKFPRTDRATWRKNVDATLKGRTFEEALVRQTAEGLSLEPLYDDRPAAVEPGVPGSYSFVRGLPRPASAEPRRGWTRSVEIAHPDIERANAMLLADLDGGAERALVRLASASRSLSLPQSSA